MKKIKIVITADVSDSADIEDFVSDLQDTLLCDSVAHAEIEYEKNGCVETSEFDNDDWEE